MALVVVITSTPNGAVWDVTLNFTILKDGVPFTEFDALDQKRFYVNRYDSTAGVAGEFYEAFQSLGDFAMGAPGNYVATRAGLTFDPTVSGQVYGYIAQGALFTHDSPSSELPAGSHVHLYDDVANTAIGFGDAASGSGNEYVSAANADGCENCHGWPGWPRRLAVHGRRAIQLGNGCCIHG